MSVFLDFLRPRRRLQPNTLQSNNEEKAQRKNKAHKENGLHGTLPPVCVPSVTERRPPRTPTVCLASGTERKALKGRSKTKQPKEKSYFPFQRLPLDCKLKVFMFLNMIDKGRSAQVCTEWQDLLKMPSLWVDVDFTLFPLCFNANTGHTCNRDCYEQYQIRVKASMKHLAAISPVMKRFCFAFDIGDFADGWLNSVEDLILHSNFRDLTCVYLNWKETPVKPFWIEQVQYKWEKYNDYVYRHRRRGRCFVNFFDLFTSQASNIKCLALPFYWNERSVRNMARLRNLEVLILEKDYVFQIINQSHLNELLLNLPKLRKLVLEVWIPERLWPYEMTSESLQHLDISQCRGFCLKKVNMPNLETFRVTLFPTGDSSILIPDTFPCLHDVLVQGAPELKSINGLKLPNDWKLEISPQMESLYRTVCPCIRHKPSQLA
ncbi:uncharacterized protein LOC106171930 [Lingula anatina]|uniref:Uncharacterized protein LOC106171930 n=1 Tax=Lingula anatina TaxID=7574 RepID=A0A1S3JCL6_LINAN|nr:uncharacterized protein LOC106171930 [Lingula anatina]XP_013407926.1 uncharacterized protein LOC106171930 [Lingula anatina]|eukprot:XP_013407918.1 uncharacterized protein LOC106171930 [Lingula anatina]